MFYFPTSDQGNCFLSFDELCTHIFMYIHCTWIERLFPPLPLILSPPPPMETFSNGPFLTIYYFKAGNFDWKINGLHHSTSEASETMGHKGLKCCISYKGPNYGHCCVKIPEKNMLCLYSNYSPKWR